MDASELAYTALGLKISLKNMYQPAPNVLYQEPSICVYGHKLKTIKKFVYLGNGVNMTSTLDD